MKFCQIIPDKLLEKIKDVKSLVISEKIRNKRTELLFSEVLPTPGEHDEIRILYNNHNGELIDDRESNIVQIDKQHHETTPSTNSDLELTNKAYDFWHDQLNRESFDDRNSIIKMFIHVGEKYNNAFWDGVQLAFGDGDQEVFKTFTTQNIVMHELTHAVTEYTAGLIYENQSGALNEHISDVFAVCLDQKLLNQSPAQASWLVGEGIFTSEINAKGLRTFKNELAYDDPLLGQDEQPKHMKDLYTGFEDNGGVHINSGIVNRAFYEFCIRTGKNSWGDPMHLWYDTLLITKPVDDFVTFAKNTVKIATNTLSVEDKNNLIRAWEDVGIKTETIPIPPPVPKPTPDQKKSFFQYLVEFIKLILSFLKF